MRVHDQTLNARFLGRVGYDEALELQHSMQQARRDEKIGDTLLFLEHPPCYTCGKRAQSTDFKVSPEILENLGYEIHQTSRGGQITYHGPGQLVVYFIINLYDAQRELRDFVTRIETGLCSYLAQHWNLDSRTESENPGVWVGQEKIAAIGIAINRKITMHGIALNVTTDLSDFDTIVPCGIRDRGVCSIQSLTGQAPALADVAKDLGDSLCCALSRDQLVWS